MGNPLENDDNALTDGQPDEPGGAPDPGAGPGSGRGDGGGGGDNPCADFGDRQEECGGGGGYYGYDYDADDYRQQCEAALDYFEDYGGAGCREAWAAFFACIAEQDCQSFACSSEQNAADTACGQAEPGTTSG